MEFIKVEDCCEILDSQRKPVTESERVSGMYPYYGANGIQGTINQYIFDDKLVLVAEDGGHFGSKTKPIAYLVNGKCWVNNHAHVLRAKKDFLAEYICYSLMFYKIEGYINGATRQKLTQAALRKLIIPKRTVEYQKAIVDRLDLVKCIIEKKQNIINELDLLIKSRFVEMFGDIRERGRFKAKKWKDVLDIFNGKDYKAVQVDKGGYPVYGSGGIIARANDYICPAGTIIIGRKGSINNPILVNEKFWNVDTAFGIVPKEIINISYLYYFCKQYNFNNLNKATTLPSLTKRDLLEIEINIPDLEEQVKFSGFVNQINKLKADVQKSIDETQLLMDSLMQEYFG